MCKFAVVIFAVFMRTEIDTIVYPAGASAFVLNSMIVRTLFGVVRLLIIALFDFELFEI